VAVAPASVRFVAIIDAGNAGRQQADTIRPSYGQRL
jgi:hypothetical protein